MAGQVKPIPVPVILAAVNGDENALAAVVAHYRGFPESGRGDPFGDSFYSSGSFAGADRKAVFPGWGL